MAKPGGIESLITMRTRRETTFITLGDPGTKTAAYLGGLPLYPWR